MKQPGLEIVTCSFQCLLRCLQYKSINVPCMVYWVGGYSGTVNVIYTLVNVIGWSNRQTYRQADRQQLWKTYSTVWYVLVCTRLINIAANILGLVVLVYSRLLKVITLAVVKIDSVLFRRKCMCVVHSRFLHIMCVMSSTDQLSALEKKIRR